MGLRPAAIKHCRDMPESSRPFRNRVSAACDACKSRKVKCDGLLPCAFCLKRGVQTTCKYSIPRLRYAPPSPMTRGQSVPETTSPIQASPGTMSRAEVVDDEETTVPRDARLLRDAQGKLIFIGDSAPLSFLQTVRHLVTSRIDPKGFATQAARDPVIEQTSPSVVVPSGLSFQAAIVNEAAESFLVSTTGLLDIFESPQALKDSLNHWVRQPHQTDPIASAVYHLVLAIGCQTSDDAQADRFFKHGRQLALDGLGGHLVIATVQAFILVAVYMLSACQTNGAFLYFALATRTAYSLGIHRTEVNAHFGAETHILRDRIWKSLRVVDLFLSCSLGRPPATSDIDCTVAYKASNESSRTRRTDILDASCQAFLITERIIVEIYSRKEISVRLAERISLQLREWSNRWLDVLSEAAATSQIGGEELGNVIGASQALCSYYYTVMLLTRPFLIYELHENLAAQSPSDIQAHRGSHSSPGRSKFAHATIDAAILMVQLVDCLINRGLLKFRMPLIVSWLFTATLVLGLALLTKDGRSFESNAKKAIACLEHFARQHGDQHALQYSLISESLFKTTISFVEKRERIEWERRTQASSQLFGLMPSGSIRSSNDITRTEAYRHSGEGIVNSITAHGEGSGNVGPSIASTSPLRNSDWAALDSEMLALPGARGPATDEAITNTHDPDPFGVLPLYPMFNFADTMDYSATFGL